MNVSDRKRPRVPSSAEIGRLELAAIEGYVHDHLADALLELSELCRQPSVSATGEGMHECAQLVAAMLRQRGFAVTEHDTDGYPIVVGHAAGPPDSSRLLFYCHYDVQPADPLDLWHTPPFEPSLRDDALYARGAVDDKGELVARLLALDAVRSVRGGYPCEIIFLIEGEEETGSPSLGPFIDDHLDELACDGAIWESGGTDREGLPKLELGSRGTLYVELSVRTLDQDAHSGHANLLPSAAWRLVWALASLKSPDEPILIDGFADNVRPPTEHERELLRAAAGEVEAVRRAAGARAVALARSGAESVSLSEWRFAPTCNIDGISTGYQGRGMKTIVPAVATAKLDFRLVPDQRPTEILTNLRAHLDDHGFSDVALTVLEADPPGQTDPASPFVQLWAETAQEVYELPPIILPLSGGTTPLHFFTSRGIPVVSVGAGYDEGFGNKVHAPNEHIRVGDLAKAATHAALLTLRFSNRR
jgi:acetylornithine deacetylase/succinyl-diaminopimelate desuccinylase-like protein